MSQNLMKKIMLLFFEYDTPRMVLVRDKKVGFTFRLIQLCVLIYVVGWVFIYERGYQTVDGIVSSVSVKLKGIAFTNVSGMGPQIWDAAGYVFPAQGDNSFVVMTNFIATPDQKLNNCAELPDAAGHCSSDSDCRQGEFTKRGQGVMTGKCINFSNTIKTCEIFSWCPVEIDYIIPKPPLLRAAVNFTLFIKNSIAFPRSHVFRRNLVETITSNTLKSCIYHKTKAPLCPVFRLGYIVNESGQQFDKIAYKGGTVGIRINWDCDLDWPVRFCIPVYTFHALDDAKSNISQGFNFRFAKYYIENGIRKRTLYKVFGIRFDIMITGKGGQFDIIPTMTMIGSGVGIFGVATVICDLLLLHILPKRKYYKKKKFKNAKKNSQKDPTTVPGDMEASQREGCPPSPDEMTLANATSHEPSEKSMEQFPPRRSTLTFPPRRSALTSIMGWFMEMVSSVTESEANEEPQPSPNNIQKDNTV
ncbi:P2X purinoceptor 1 isoform X2 [Microcaecilia unicolor]|uniref:P2X purinoceptor n=1 Tax=Microcaecilia unicolor TaxID=1415580 RepID=A0A6P7WF71_9AMPH|nr:P2X purinoceptor 1-like isoform X2 [Microcaecilia unicolor]